MSLEPILINSIANLYSKSAAGLLTDVIKALVDRYNTAKSEYAHTSVDASASVEQKRLALLKELTVCQNRILFEVSDPELIGRIVPFAIEQGACIFSAAKLADLTLAEMNIQQIKSVLDRNAEFKRRRQMARTLVVVFNVVAIAILGLLCYKFSTQQISGDERIPLLNVPWTVVLWSGIGSLGAMLYRFNKSADAEMADPLRWCFTRPLTGVLMGIVAYLALRIGSLVLDSAAKNAVNSPELLWIVAFLAGFSDKFSDAVLHTLNGRLGGDKRSELVTIDAPNASIQAATHAIVERLGWQKKKETEKSEPHASDSPTIDMAPVTKPKKYPRTKKDGASNGKSDQAIGKPRA